MAKTSSPQSSRRHAPGRKSIVSVTSALILAAFVSTGAFSVLTKLTESFSVWMMLSVSGVWAVLLAAGRLPEAKADKRIVAAAAAVAGAAVLSSLASAQPLYSIVYDSYAHMPLVVWLAALAALVMASKLHFASEVRNGLVLVLSVAAFPLVVGAGQAVLGRLGTVFGNSNYFVSVMILLAPIALGLARTASSGREKVVWRVYAAAIGAGVLAQGTLIGYIAVPATLLLILAVDPRLLHDSLQPAKILRIGAAALVGLLVAAFAIGTVPALNGGTITPKTAMPLGLNAVARVDLWEGAQTLFSKHPWLGLGAGGYKLVSVDYLDPSAFRVAVTPEPIDVSPPSPHSIIWTAATGVGAIGTLALAGLFAVWVIVLWGLRDASDAARSLRMSLAIGFVAYAVVLLTVPVSAAQGLLPALVAGLAIASPAKPSPGRQRRVARSALMMAAGVLAIGLAIANLTAYAVYWTMDPDNVAGTLRRFDAAEALQPGDPLYRFRRYEYRFLTAASASEARDIREDFDAESGVLKTYAPGLVDLAELSMEEAQRDGRKDLSWEAGMLQAARRLAPYFPNLVAADLHLAVLQGKPAEIARALATAEKDKSGYPLLPGYIERAKAALAAEGRPGTY